VYMAYENGDVHLHARIKFNLPPEKFDPKSAERPKYIDTTVGRVIFNFSFPSDVQLPYMNYTIDKKKLAEIVARCYRLYGTTKTAAVLDALKTLGFKFATISGSTIAISDIDIPPDKPAILAQAEKEEGILEAQYRKGLITEEERRDRMIAIWEKASDSVKDAMLKHLDPMNPVYMMAISGARGNISQVRQLAGMRGLMADPSGRIIPLPIKANLREGLTVLEYFISTHGARKGLADTALRTADSGYLTRRLIDVTQDIIVREEDCGSTNYIEMEALVDIGREGKVINEIVTLRERIVGRTSAEDIYFEGKELLCKANQEITEEIADRILEAGFTKVKLRSVLTCQSRYGVCAKCYGRNLATGLPVDIGETVGIIAAQSIGEPGTQLTLRTFHTGGIATEDIIQGLPRVEELFEARKPKTCGVLSETKGVVRIVEEKGHRKVIVVSPDGVEHAYPAPYGVRLKVQNGQMVDVGDQITEGPLNPHEILRIRGVTEVQRYLVDEVQRVYRSQGVDINDKHIEVIVRQMLRKVRVDEPGDTELLPGGLVDIFEFEDENKRVLKAKGKPAKGRPVLLGVTKASLACNSFLSAASFQETTRVLTEAAIKGKVDPLLGLKENVIIGKLIPAGTGMSRYRDIEVVTDAGTPPPLISLPEVPVVETPTYLDEDGRQKQEVGKSRRESKTKD
jgi:DNA-directed RNA polymerase subunit beta'